MSRPESAVHPAAGQDQPLEIELRLLKARLDKVERQVRALADANAALARGLEAGPLQEPGGNLAAQSARLAHELLLAADLIERGEGGAR